MTLLRALSEIIGRELAPDRVVVHRNVGLVPAPAGTPEDHVANRGFNLQILGPDGRSTHYVKCRSIGSARARHEARLLAALAATHATAGLVPSSQVVEVGDVFALVTGFMDARTLVHLARTASPSRVEALTEEALGAADAVAAVLTPLLDPARDREAEREEVFRALRDLGVHSATMDLLARRLDELPRHGAPPQHGDLTARNILVAENRPVLIDLEAYGEIRDPLFDDWSLVRSLPRLGNRSSPWWEGQYAQLVHERGRRTGLDAASRRTLLAWFLARSACLLHRRAAPSDFAAVYVRELQDALESDSATSG